jgi:hypothetical protein
VAIGHGLSGHQPMSGAGRRDHDMVLWKAAAPMSRRVRGATTVNELADHQGIDGDRARRTRASVRLR